MATVKAKQADGSEIDVELPAGYIAESDLAGKYVSTEFMQAEIQRRLKGKSDKLDPDKLLDDPEFQARAREKLGLAPDKKLTGEDVEKLYRDWEQKHLHPVKEAATQQQRTVERLRERDLHGQLVGAAAGLVKKSLLQSPVPGQAPPIVHLLAPYFGYSDEADGWYVRDGDTFAYASNPTKERPFKSPAEFLAEWAKDKANADWLDDQRQRGAGLGTPGSGSGPDLSKLSPVERIKHARSQK